MDITALEGLGLTKSEIQVYLALLELGSSTTGKIVEKSRVASSKIYELLDKLISKGLASFIVKSGVKYFEAAPPERILDYAEQKEQEFFEQKKILERIIPQLELRQKLSQYTSEATIYKGIKGAETAFTQAIGEHPKGEPYFVIGIPSRSEEFNRMFVRMAKLRAKKKITQFAIVNADARGELQNLPEHMYKEDQFKFRPEITPAAINIFATKVLIVTEAKEPLLFVIENKEVVSSFKTQFDILWNQDTLIFKGVDAIKNIFNEMLEAGHCDFIGARGYFVDDQPEFVLDWEERARKKGFTMRNIVDYEIRGRKITQFPFAQTKYSLPKEFSSLSVFWIYGEKVVISNWSQEEPIVISISNKQLHDTYKEQFELFWNQQVITITGKEAVYAFFDELLEYSSSYYIGGNFGIKKYFPEYWEKYKKQRIENKCFWYDLVAATPLADESLVQEPYYSCRILPEMFSSPHVIVIYGEQAANIIWDGEQTSIIIISKKEIVQSYKQYFNFLWEQDTVTLRGYDGMISLCEHALETKEDIYIIGATGLIEITHADYFPKVIELSEKFGIRFHILANEDIRGKHFGNNTNNEMRFLPPNIKSPMTIWVFGSYTATVLSKDPQIVTLTKNEQIANHYRTYFQQLWNGVAKE